MIAPTQGEKTLSVVKSSTGGAKVKKRKKEEGGGGPLGIYQF